MTEQASSSDVPSSTSIRNGLVQVLTGEGRGKTTAALGTALRALGNDLRVCVVAFMKASQPSGEWNVLSGLPGFTAVRFGSGHFVDPERVTPEDRGQAAQAMAEARRAILSGDYDMVVLDEVNLAVAWKLVTLEEVVHLIEEKPQGVEIILTGRSADKEIIRRADLVTEMLNIKHPYEAGITARRGIEY